MRCRPQTEPLQTNRATTTATWSCTEPAQYYHDAPLYLRLPNMIGPARTVLCSQNPRGVVLKSSWPDRKKLRIEAEVYASCNGQFGVPDHLLSFEACHSDGAAFSNSIFLPPIGCTTFASYRWYPFDEHDSAASPPDYRTLQVIVIADEGESLEHCESAKDLSMCVLHAQLGWLFMMSIAGKGYLHRDASIGNVVRPNVPVQRRAFTSRRGVEELVKGLHHIKHSASSEAIESNNEGAQGSHDRSGAEGAKRHSDKEGFWTNLGGAAGHNPYLKNVVNAAQRLEKALAKLGLSTECRALLIDGECAGFLPEYFVDPPHAGNVFGTPAFMSETLIIQSQKMANSIYVHNPVDDLNSFMWTTIWGTVFNPRADASQRSAAAQETLKQWQKMLRTHERLSALHEIEGSVPDDSSPIVEGIPSLIRIWRRELEDLEITFRRTFKKAPNAEQKFDVFCRFAREGVAVYAELLHELRDTLGLDATQ
ncbi:hypothetical protein C8Q80DRAFT_373695 [Daedaleopsis nitida]|nr:hypothetical protein C8Q80DRAFT_373695 [Daedaleopsis nitida]